jgi:hypothetical protein
MLLVACKNKEQRAEEATSVEAVETSLIKSEQPITKLNPKSEALISSWPEYRQFDDLISRYQEITMNEALLNSVELSEMARQLKDSIRIEKLNVPEVKIRLNVVYSEALRLADMSTIPTVTEEMVARENDNLIAAYSALNMKINNMNLQDQLNSEINSFVDEVLAEPSRDSIPTAQNEDGMD